METKFQNEGREVASRYDNVAKKFAMVLDG
jgi:hypothetical protein